jgi:hypothetical protein
MSIYRFEYSVVINALSITDRCKVSLSSNLHGNECK